MPEYLAPGVYVEEVDTGPKPIEGVSTSTSGMVGVTERGPVNVPTLVTGYADFLRQFGATLDRRIFTAGTWYLPHAVKGFFDNGGKRVYIVRVLPDETDGATFAEAQFYDRGDTGANFATALASRAERGEGVILVQDNAGINPGDWLLIQDGASSEYHQVTGDVLALPTAVNGAQTAGTDVVGYASDGTARTLSALLNQGDTSLTLDVVTGLNAAGGDLLMIDTGSDLEFALTVSADPTNNAVPVVLTAPVAAPAGHANGAAVALMPDLGSTPLVTALSAGVMVLVVEDETQIAGATAIGFGGPPSTEFHVLQGWGVITLDQALSSNHNAGAPVTEMTFDGTARALTADAAQGDTVITLDDVTSIAANDVLRLRVVTGSGNQDEYRIVQSVAASDVTLTAPLESDYLSTQAVERFTETPRTVLSRDANPGESVAVLADLGGLAPGDLIRIENAAAPTAEYRELAANTAALLGLEAVTSSAHNFNAAVLGREAELTVQAIDRGAWGNSLRIYVDDDTSILETRIPSGGGGTAGDPILTIKSTVGIEPGTILEFYRATGTVFLQKVDNLLSGNRVSFAGGLAQNVTDDMQVRTREFKITTQAVRFNPRTQREEAISGMSETLRQLSMDPRHSRYFVRVAGATPRSGAPLRADGRTDGESNMIRMEDALTSAQAQAALRVGPDILTETLPDGRVRLVGRPLVNGDDAISAITDQTFIGSDAVDPQARTGLYALKNIDEIAIVGIPGRTSQNVQQALITHCELMRYRMAVIDSLPAAGMAEVQEQRGLYDSKYAALYYPWLQIVDPFPDNPRAPGLVSIPPSGHVMGIYARSDNERGVHKAPANEVIRGINELEVKLTKEEQDILNPRNINVLRNFRENNRGLRVWGARIVTADSDWRYVNVRRLFIFIEHSIDRGTQWVVFEPNADPLWERVRRVITAFLTSVWRDGALMGRTPEEAFFVKCDRTTMTQDDIDNGRLIVLVGIAPVKPAEFVIFRIGQWVGGSELNEG